MSMERINKVRDYLKSEEGIAEVFTMAYENDVFYADYTAEMRDKYAKDDIFYEDILADIIIGGGEITVVDTEDDEKYPIDKKKWNDAIDKIEDTMLLNTWADGCPDFEMCYAVLQYVVFGKVVYE